MHAPDFRDDVLHKAVQSHLLEEFIYCMTNDKAGAYRQVGANWPPCQNSTPTQINQMSQ